MSRDSRARPSSVSALTVFFEEQTLRERTLREQNPRVRKSQEPEKDNQRCSYNNADISKLKDEHIVSDRRKLFEKKSVSVPGNLHKPVPPACSDEIARMPAKCEQAPTPPPKPTLRHQENNNRHTLAEIQKVRRSVMDTIIKYIHEGVSEDEENEVASTPPELSDSEVEECETMISELKESWSVHDLSRLGINEDEEEEVSVSVDSKSSEIDQCVEAVNGEFNDLIALTESNFKRSKEIRRSGNFIKSNRSSSKRKKGLKKTEDVVYSYEKPTDELPVYDRNSFTSTSAYESDDYEEVFGVMTEVNDFIVEAYNSVFNKYQQPDVLCKLTLQKEPMEIPTFNDTAISETISPFNSKEDVTQIEVKVQIDQNNYENAYENCSIEIRKPIDRDSKGSDDSTEYEFVDTKVDGYIDHSYENVIVLLDSKAKDGEYENTLVCNKTLEGAYFDKNFNRRITITADQNLMLPKNEDFLTIPKRFDSQLSSPTPKKQHIIDELRKTEEKYLNGLEYAIHEYLKYFMNHPDVKHLSGNIKSIFGNIEDIFAATKKFYLKLCDCGYSVECIAQLFLNSEKMFLLCSDYMRNKSKTLHVYEQYYNVLSERQKQLNDKKTCDSYLLSPVQRPTRYKLLLENLNKEIKKQGEHCPLLEEAVKFLDENISEANRLLAIDSIRGCVIDLTTKGPLILKDTFNIKKKYKSYVFLFRDVVVFTTESKIKQDNFEYKDSILSVDLTLKHQTNSNTFVLTDYTKSKLKLEDGAHRYEIEAGNAEICTRWVKEITDILWRQLTTFKNLQKKKMSPDSFNPRGNQQLYCTLSRDDDKTKRVSPQSLTRNSVFYISND